MSMEANRELGCEFFKSQDHLRGGPDSHFCAPNYRAYIAGNPPMALTDHEGFAKAFYTAFPDLQHTIEETLVDHDRVTVRFTLRGTHTGEFMGIPPTNKSIEIGVIAILSIANGQVCELRAQFDQFGMMQQLGVVQ
jgi:predicted ester cyclase